jgi:hypothetical protein
MRIGDTHETIRTPVRVMSSLYNVANGWYFDLTVPEGEEYNFGDRMTELRRRLGGGAVLLSEFADGVDTESRADEDFGLVEAAG